MKFALAGYNAGEGAVQISRHTSIQGNSGVREISVPHLQTRTARQTSIYPSKQPRDANLERDLAMLKGQPVSNRVLATCRA